MYININIKFNMYEHIKYNNISLFQYKDCKIDEFLL